MEDTSTLVEHLHSFESSQMRSYMKSVKKTPTSATSKGSSSACASRITSLFLVLFKAVFYFIHPILRFLHPTSKRRSADDELMVIQIEEYYCTDGMSTLNTVFEASQLYLHNKISPSTRLLKIAQVQKETKFSIHFSNKQEFEDTYEGFHMKWKYNFKSKKSNKSSIAGEKQFFELTFDVKHKEKVMEAYLPYVIETSKAMKDAAKIVKLHTLVRSDAYTVMRWRAFNLKHPATFDIIAMDTEQKRLILEDLDRFVKRKEFYQRVGRAWKRGYLLYGPPGTGKSSLIAAIANYLKFDIYDLQLTHLTSDMELRRVLLATTNKSILLIEDIDCSQLKLQDKSNSSKKNDSESNQLSLSGLLNFTDGIWSSCGEERIIVFTTNHKSKLEPALLRSGRMDMHIHMSYCSYEGFKILASTYLGIKEHQPLFDEIESLLQKTDVTPAQVAEELMKSEDANVALQALITRLQEMKKKKEDEKKTKDEAKVKKDSEKDDPKQLTYFI